MDNQPLDDQKLFEYTLRSLGARDQTSTEISRKLARRGADEAQCARIIERLTRSGIISDSDYAERFVERRGTTRGKMLLGMELRRKGIDPAPVLAERTDDIDTDAVANTLRRRIGSKPIQQSVKNVKSYPHTWHAEALTTVRFAVRGREWMHPMTWIGSKRRKVMIDT